MELMSFHLLVFIFLILLMVIIAIKGVIIVRQQEAMIIESLGKYCKTLEPGFNIILPFLEKPRPVMKIENIKSKDGKIISKFVPSKVIDLRETVFSIPNQTVISYDNTEFKVNLFIYFQIVDPKRAVYQVANLPVSLETLIKTELFNLAKAHTPYDICTANEELTIILDKKTDNWGVKVHSAKIQICDGNGFTYGDSERHID